MMMMLYAVTMMKGGNLFLSECTYIMVGRARIAARLLCCGDIRIRIQFYLTRPLLVYTIHLLYTIYIFTEQQINLLAAGNVPYNGATHAQGETASFSNLRFSSSLLFAFDDVFFC